VTAALLPAATIDSGDVVSTGVFATNAVTNFGSSGGGYSIFNGSSVGLSSACAPCAVGATISGLTLFNGFDQPSGTFTTMAGTQTAQLRATGADTFVARDSNYLLTAAPFTVTTDLQQTTTFTMVGSLYGTIPTGFNTFTDVLTDPAVTGSGIVIMNFTAIPGPGQPQMQLTSAQWMFAPEPSTYATVGVVLSGLVWIRRRKR